jgi:histidyl-tRNA synthetase
VAVNDEASRPSSTRVATALRARGIPCEVAPAAAKFGKQIRYAERRGIPYVWFPGAGESGDQVKDIRSGVQVDADGSTWSPPAEDLAPQIVRA